MKKSLIIGIVGILVLGVIGFFLLRTKKTGIFCPDYDGKKQKCLFHSACKWDPSENNCDPIGSMEGNHGDENDGYDSDETDEDADADRPNRELEAIKVPNNLPNKLCKQIPLSNRSPYSERYRCLAIVNHDERFCEGIDEESEKTMCLAFTKEDSSYCKLISDQESKTVCYLQLSVSSENASFCSDITYSQHEKEQCYMNYITNLYAWNQSDEIKPEYCNKLDTPDKYTCFALRERDVSLCGGNPHCLTFFEQDVSFCDDHPELPCCIKDRAKTSRDVSICDLLPQPDRDNCVGSYCTHTELDVGICDTIVDVKERQDRYLELAMNLANRER